ncbi:alpha/beta fold hydrolase [Bacteroidota bacterium]
MKKLFIILQFSLLSLWINPIMGQEQIQYGSNNGQYISIYNTGIYYEEYGRGIPLLLLHGSQASIEYFKMVIPELSNHFRVIAIDAPGHGRSYHSDSISDQLLCDYMSELIDVMELDSVYLFGCSLGANLALHLAYERPDKVKRVIGEGTILNPRGYSINAFELTESMGETENMPKWWVDKYNNLNPQKELLPKFLKDLSRMRFDGPTLTDSEVRNIKARTLIIMGDRDWAIKLEYGLELYRIIEGSEFCVIPAGAHCLCDKKPDLMNNIVIDFLTKE